MEQKRLKNRVSTITPGPTSRESPVHVVQHRGWEGGVEWIGLKDHRTSGGECDIHRRTYQILPIPERLAMRTAPAPTSPKIAAHERFGKYDHFDSPVADADGSELDGGC